LASTIHYYFDGRKELFEGLAMEELEKDWIQYPVLHFDFSRVKVCPPDVLQEEINNMLSEYDASYGVETTGLLGSRLDKLIRALYNKTGKQVVLLIDEYDAPMMNVLHKPDILQEVRSIMRDFYTSLKANNAYLRFVFITGVSTFSQMGIFSELNNLDVISDDDDYATICGITEQELVDNFKQGIEVIASKKNWTEEETLARLKDMYDGYHFSGDLIDVYNPFSLIKAFKSKVLGNYWFNTGTTSSLVEAFKQYIGDFNLELDTIDSDRWIESCDFRRSLEDHASIIPLLYQTGYLTIKKYDTDSDQYVLGMPNAEVRVGMLKNLLSLYLSINEKVVSAPAKDASEALRNGDINRAMEILRSLLKSIPYGKNETKKFHDIKTTEQYYHDLFHFFFSMMCDLVSSEVRHATGATDVVITTPKYIYVVEIKINSSPDVALKQIDEKGYAVPYMAGHRAVIKVGANFSTKEKTLSDWTVVEAKGVTI
jgi:AcrR family transcriptional regulator